MPPMGLSASSSTTRPLNIFGPSLIRVSSASVLSVIFLVFSQLQGGAAVSRRCGQALEWRRLSCDDGGVNNHVPCHSAQESLHVWHRRACPPRRPPRYFNVSAGRPPRRTSRTPVPGHAARPWPPYRHFLVSRRRLYRGLSPRLHPVGDPGPAAPRHLRQHSFQPLAPHHRPRPFLAV